MEDNSWLGKKMNMRKSHIPRRESISLTLAPEVRENLPVLEECVCMCVYIYMHMHGRAYVGAVFLYVSLSSMNFIMKAVKSH